MHKVEKQIEIKAPVAVAFNLFSRLDHCARWMKGVKHVEWIAPGRTRWIAEATDGTRLEWEAEVTELEPGRHIAWHSTGGDIETEGEARFAPTKQGTTLMQLALGYDQPQWQSEEANVTSLTENLEERLGEDLIWFRLYAEREARTNGAESLEAAPAAVSVAPTDGDSSVHFESFSGMLRAGQVIRPARPITAQFETHDESPAVAAPPPSSSGVAASRLSRRPIFAYAAIGLLLVVAIGLFVATRKRESVAEQPSAQTAASPLATPFKPSNKPVAGNETIAAAQPTAPTPAPKVTPALVATSEPPAAETTDEAPIEETEADADTRAAINATVNGWLSATTNKDIEAQMSFYAPTLNRYYLRNNYTRDAVRADKARRFAQADAVSMNASAPQISLDQNGRTARVRFRKQYEITSGAEIQSGAVLQELVLTRSGDGWRIVSERDLRVLR